jgi:hypothetical protein
MITTKERSYAVVGLRLGSKISTPTGFVRNGEISDFKQIEYLREVGYTLTECAGIPEFDEAAVAARERNAEKMVVMV